MRRVPLSIERAKQSTEQSEGSAGVPGVSVLKFDSMAFKEDGAAFGAARSQTLNLGSGFEATQRIVALDAMRLHGPSYSMLDGGSSLLLTHVLRQSQSSLKWRNGWGEISLLEPGDVFINQGRRDSLIELSPSPPDGQCDCVRIVLQTCLATDLSLRFEAHDFSFRNSPEACVRIILGSYREHVARSSLLPDLTLLDIDIAPLSEMSIPIAEEQYALLILTSGSLDCSSTTVEPWHAMAFHGQESFIRLATRTGASVLWLVMPSRPATLSPAEVE